MSGQPDICPICSTPYTAATTPGRTDIDLTVEHDVDLRFRPQDSTPLVSDDELEKAELTPTPFGTDATETDTTEARPARSRPKTPLRPYVEPAPRPVADSPIAGPPLTLTPPPLPATHVTPAAEPPVAPSPGRSMWDAPGATGRRIEPPAWAPTAVPPTPPAPAQTRPAPPAPPPTPPPTPPSPLSTPPATATVPTATPPPPPAAPTTITPITSTAPTTAAPIAPIEAMGGPQPYLPTGNPVSSGWGPAAPVPPPAPPVPSSPAPRRSRWRGPLAAVVLLALLAGGIVWQRERVSDLVEDLGDRIDGESSLGSPDDLPEPGRVLRVSVETARPTLGPSHG